MILGYGPTCHSTSKNPAMHEAVVYFAGPATTWARKPQEIEYIARFTTRSAFMARVRAVSCHARLNKDRCGWFIRKDGTVIAHVPAIAPTTAPP